MPNNNNLIPKENIAKVEEVREIDNEIPSYEEFMKTYENDDNLNYDDLNGGNAGEVKGYGPTWVDPDIKEFARKEREKEEMRHKKRCPRGCGV